MRDYPTPWQRKMMWAALTACFVVILVVILVAVIWAGASIVSFLQPILIPVAIAAILAYLLDPLVTKMSRGVLTRTEAIALLFAIGFFALGGLAACLRAPDCRNYVGLHPMTVIVSIFVWGLGIGGVIGPLLAVPLTATIEVLFGRYVWHRRLREQSL